MVVLANISSNQMYLESITSTQPAAPKKNAESV